ncbi:LLM class flavin-dependent oxidoreductase [Nonomuraea pusilla]|uniref:LLM class flavin-dependent oxidoreductase n=1 Tax=Nonomuraea pusilla TaxID=46177 RepID=UPI0033243AC9
MAQAALLLSATRQTVITTGTASIYARDAISAAAAERTLAEAFPGRFLLGLGVSHPALVTDVRGHRFGPPVATMRAYLDAIAVLDRRRLVRGCGLANHGQHVARDAQQSLGHGPMRLPQGLQALASLLVDRGHPLAEHRHHVIANTGPDCVHKGHDQRQPLVPVGDLLHVGDVGDPTPPQRNERSSLVARRPATSRSVRSRRYPPAAPDAG